MSQPPLHLDPDRLFAKLLEEGLQGPERDLLSEALRRDASLRELYRKYMMVDALLRWELAPPLLRLDGERADEIPNPQSPIPNPSFIPPIIVDLPPAAHAPLFSLQSPVGNFLFSYSAAAVLVGIALLIGLAWRISSDQQVCHKPTIVADGPLSNLAHPSAAAGRSHHGLGRLPRSGGRWSVVSGPSSAIPNRHIPVPLAQSTPWPRASWRSPTTPGPRSSCKALARMKSNRPRRFPLVGQADRRVEVRDEGLRDSEARISGSKGERTANLALSQEGGQPTTSLAPRPSSPTLPSCPYPLFSVRTPTAIVTDLGTEFGVEVDRSGGNRSHVFRGKVELRSANSREPTAPGDCPAVVPSSWERTNRPEWNGARIRRRDCP